MIRVVVVDDHSAVRHGVAQVIGGLDGAEFAGAAAGGEQAVALCAAARPDVVLMDLSLPGGIDGVEATRRIRAADPRCQVVILTSFSDRERIVAALDAGAIGYILKDGDPDELGRAVRAAARGEFPIDPRAARALLAGGAVPDPQAGLSARERDVLALVAAGLTNREIADRLGVSERTVKGHLTACYRHLGVTDRTQAALWAHRNALPTVDGRAEG